MGHTITADISLQERRLENASFQRISTPRPRTALSAVRPRFESGAHRERAAARGWLSSPVVDSSPTDGNDVDVAPPRAVLSDEASLKAAYEEHGPLIYNYCRRALGADVAHDLTQEVFLSAWRAKHTFNPEKGSLGGWLMGITKNRIIDRHRKDGRQVPRSTNEYAEPSSADDSAGVADRMMLVDALARLPERQQKVMKLAFFQDLTQQQIADKIGLPLGTVKSDMRRSLTKLKRDLERDR